MSYQNYPNQQNNNPNSYYNSQPRNISSYNNYMNNQQQLSFNNQIISSHPNNNLYGPNTSNKPIPPYVNPQSGGYNYNNYINMNYNNNNINNDYNNNINNFNKNMPNINNNFPVNNNQIILNDNEASLNQLINEKNNLYSQLNSLNNIVINDSDYFQINKLNNEIKDYTSNNNYLIKIHEKSIVEDLNYIKNNIIETALDDDSKDYVINLELDKYVNEDDQKIKNLFSECKYDLLERLNYKTVTTKEKSDLIEYVRNRKEEKSKKKENDNINLNINKFNDSGFENFNNNINNVYEVDKNSLIQIQFIYPHNTGLNKIQTFKYGDDPNDMIMRVYQDNPNFENPVLSYRNGEEIKIDPKVDKYLGRLFENHPKEVIVKNSC